MEIFINRREFYNHIKEYFASETNSRLILRYADYISNKSNIKFKLQSKNVLSLLLGSFISQLKTKWKQYSRTLHRFESNEYEWLNTTLTLRILLMTILILKYHP